VIDNFLLPQNSPAEAYLPWVEEMPEPAGGMEEIVRRMKYPEEAKNQGIEGRVFVKLFINEFGKPENSEVIRSVHPLLDTEARNVLMKTIFSPGRRDGKPVKVQVVVPILFQLDNNNKSNKKGSE
jgi:protein TonB